MKIYSIAKDENNRMIKSDNWFEILQIKLKFIEFIWKNWLRLNDIQLEVSYLCLSEWYLRTRKCRIVWFISDETMNDALYSANLLIKNNI